MTDFKILNYDSSETSDLSCAFKGEQYYVHTYGCQLNENDSEKISGILEEIGMTETEDMSCARILVFNTCTIRENANGKFFGNLGMVKKIKESNQDIIVILCGCMMKEEHNVKKIKDKFKFVDIIFGPSDIYMLPKFLIQKLNDNSLICSVGPDNFISEALPVSHKRKFRALTTIIYGCNNFCSYCIVPYVRGRERSRNPESIINELTKLAKEGYKEILLLGQNVNSYGKDFQNYNFSNLLSDVSKIDGISRIRFMTSHPKDISRNLIDVMASSKKIMPHLHLPLQSGSDNILKTMNRGYTTKQYLDIAKYAREKIPNVSITTDIIVGFPGETEEDFSNTLDVMNEIRFDNAFTFMYSPRKGTPAADYENQITKETMKERFGRLVKLQNSCSLESNMKNQGKVVEVLIEGHDKTKKDILTGRTPDSKLVNFSYGAIKNTKEDMEGKIALVKIIKAKTFSLDGEGVKIIEDL